MSEEFEETTLPTPVWLGLIVITAVSFWAQAKVTEDRFVPALNVIAHFYNIPDDIAGATLVAAGASSPELFSSITALFITKSSLGLGTIVGSEIFNQLIICAGAVFATRGGLVLDPAIVIREVFFYALSILLLYFSLRDARPDPDDPSGDNHIYISFYEACYVFAGYIAYVLVCANMDAIVACFSKKEALKGTSSGDGYGSIEGGSKPLSGRVMGVSLKHINHGSDERALFLREAHCDHEPAGNFERLELLRTATGESHPRMPSTQPPPENAIGSLPSTLSLRKLDDLETAKELGKFSDGRSLRNVHFLAQEQPPSNEHGLMDIELNQTTGRLSCFMWQRSYFYDKARFAIRGWHLRWFTLTPGTISSVPNRAFADRHQTTYPHFNTIDFDAERLIIRINNPSPNHRNFYLLSPSKAIFEAVLSKMDEFMDMHEDEEGAATVEKPPKNFEEETHESLIEYHDVSTAGFVLFLFLFPIRFLMHWTIPDVRLLDTQGNPLPTLSKAYAAVVSCLLWLIVGSYAMVSSLEHLAAWLNIPAAVVGVTVSAAGTSLPNYVASKIAAEKGFGNMAVSNAFGSNTFNIMVGLGLPWVLYTSFGTHFQPYHGLRDEGITESVLILGSCLLVFVVAVLQSGFVLYRWHAVLFVLLYVAYIGYEVGLVFQQS